MDSSTTRASVQPAHNCIALLSQTDQAEANNCCLGNSKKVPVWYCFLKIIFSLQKHKYKKKIKTSNAHLNCFFKAIHEKIS